MKQNDAKPGEWGGRLSFSEGISLLALAVAVANVIVLASL
jgi:hypothetical protein